MSRQKRTIDLSIKPKKAIVAGVVRAGSDDTDLSLVEVVMMVVYVMIVCVG